MGYGGHVLVFGTEGEPVDVTVACGELAAGVLADLLCGEPSEDDLDRTGFPVRPAAVGWLADAAGIAREVVAQTGADAQAVARTVTAIRSLPGGPVRVVYRMP